MPIFHGLSAFPITPADERGIVDTDGVMLLTARLAEAKVDSIGLLGSTGTYAYLTRAERRRAIRAAVASVGGRTPLIVGVGALRTDEAEALAADARDAGLDEPEDPACVVQVLRYEPVPAPGCAVDPLSAILSLPADERDDPRIAGEIENVLTRVLGGEHEGNR